MSDAQVSIIVPCYEQQQYLQRAFDSVAQQSYRDIEVIVVDDGSQEPVVIPLGDWWFETRLIRQPNGGLSAARNRGLAEAKGRYVKFLDADDALLPECLSMQVAAMGGRDDVISVIGFYEEDEETGKRRKLLPAFGDIREALLQVNIGPPHCYLYSRQAIDAVGRFCTGERVAGGHEDYDLALRLAASGCYGVTVHRPGVVYYKRSGSMSHKYEPMTRTRAAVWAENLPAILNSADDDGVLLASLFGWAHLLSITPESLGVSLYQAGDLLAQALGRVKRLPAAEVAVLDSLLQDIDNVVTEPVREALRKVERDAPAPLFQPQELIERRLGAMAGSHNTGLYEELIHILLSMSEFSSEFAIYGAGEIGKRLAAALADVGIKPKLFVDQMAKKGQAIDGVPVCTLESDELTDIEAVIIASEKFYNEMREKLLERIPGVTILNEKSAG